MFGDTHTVLRGGLLAILLVGIAGTSTELLLLGHYEDWRQFVPLVANGLVLIVLAWYRLGGGRRSVRALQLLMVALLLAGLAGVALHYLGSLEFQQEADPSGTGWELFTRAVRATAPPVLAPAIMLQLGLVGLLYAYRHPALNPHERSPR